MFKSFICLLIDIGAWICNPLRLPVCRFNPSCSVYAKECVRTHGIYAAGLIIRRLLKCHPWGSCGADPVPARRDA